MRARKTIKLSDGQEINESRLYTKTYTIRRTGRRGLSYETSLPPIFIEREARSRGLTVDQFLAQFVAEVRFNDFHGLHTVIVERPNPRHTGR